MSPIWANLQQCSFFDFLHAANVNMTADMLDSAAMSVMSHPLSSLTIS